DPNATATITLPIALEVGGKELVLGEETTLEHGERLKLTGVVFFVAEPRLATAEGSWVAAQSTSAVCRACTAFCDVYRKWLAASPGPDGDAATLWRAARRCGRAELARAEPCGAAGRVPKAFDRYRTAGGVQCGRSDPSCLSSERGWGHVLDVGHAIRLLAEGGDALGRARLGEARPPHWVRRVVPSRRARGRARARGRCGGADVGRRRRAAFDVTRRRVHDSWLDAGLDNRAAE